MTAFKLSVFVYALLRTGVSGAEEKAASQQEQTPLGRVMEVITKIRREVLKEDIAEEEIYNNFACFCKDKTGRLEKMVKHHASKIDLSSANIADWTARSNGLDADTRERRENHEIMQKQRDDYKKQLTDENTNWQNLQAEYSNNRRLISQALSAMKDSKRRVSAASFLQAPGVAKYLAMADAMGLLTTPKQKELAASLLQGMNHTNATSALLQGGSRVNKSHGNPMESYGYHGGSNDIIKLVESLMGQMQTLHRNQQDEHVKAADSYRQMVYVLKRKLLDNDRRIEDNKHEVSTFKKQTAQARQVLIENQQDLDETNHVLKEVTSACTSRANEYDARSSARQAELKALTTALACLSNARPAADRTRIGSGGMLVQAPPAKAKPGPNRTQVIGPKGTAPATPAKKVLSLLQELSTQNHGSSFLSRNELSQDDLKRRARDVLLSEGQRTNSVMLTSLASHLESDPFEKVKKLLSDLRFRLEAEAQQETNKKVWCDEELEKTKHEMGTRYEETKHLTMLLRRYDARRDSLKLSIKFNTEKAIEIGKSIKSVFTDASQLNAEQLRQFNEQKEARDELKEAIKILKKYYSGAAKALGKAFLQSYVSQPTRAQRYRTERKQISKESERRAEAHADRKEAREEKERRRIGELDGDVPAGDRLGTMGDALALLETVASDFDREIGNLEGDMSEEYKELHKTNEILKAQKVHAEELTELDKQELNTTKINTAAKFDDLRTAQNLLDNALREMEDLKPSCIDTGMSYADRVAKRKAEMKALTVALCILGEKGKKAGCPTQVMD